MYANLANAIKGIAVYARVVGSSGLNDLNFGLCLFINPADVPKRPALRPSHWQSRL